MKSTSQPKSDRARIGQLLRVVSSATRAGHLWHRRTPYTLHPTPHTLHPTPFTLHPTPYNLHPTLYTLHPTPYTLHPKPCTLHPTPYTLHPTPYPLPPKVYKVHPGPAIFGAGERCEAVDSVRDLGVTTFRYRVCGEPPRSLGYYIP